MGLGVHLLFDLLVVPGLLALRLLLSPGKIVGRDGYCIGRNCLVIASLGFLPLRSAAISLFYSLTLLVLVKVWVCVLFLRVLLLVCRSSIFLFL
jgi:hypothetical protein